MVPPLLSKKIPIYLLIFKSSARLQKDRQAECQTAECITQKKQGKNNEHQKSLLFTIYAAIGPRNTALQSWFPETNSPKFLL